MTLIRKLRGLLQRRRFDAEMADEMREHLELQTAENQSRGLAPDEARYAALRSFGGVEQLKERARDQRGGLWLGHFLSDARYAIRTLVKSPSSTALAILTLALGIGLVTIQFSIVNAVSRGLPFVDAERIALVQPLEKSGRVREVALQDFLAWRELQQSFNPLSAFASTTLEIGDETMSARSYRGAAFSVGLLELLGVRPILGRTFGGEDERTDAPPVILLGHHAWRNDFKADPAVIGRVVRLRGEAATIVGVMPPGFGFPDTEQAWVNLRPSGTADPHRPGARTTARLVGRLRDGVSMASAAAEFDIFVRAADRESSSTMTGSSRARVRPVIDPDGGKVGLIALSLLGVVGGVLALACLNVANLLSARALQRAPELALRSALGASRSRLIRQLLTESTVLAVLGSAGGILFAFWGVPLVNQRFAAMPDKPFWFVVDIDLRVLGFAIALTFLVGVVAGLFPALRATRSRPAKILKESAGGGGAGARLGFVNRALVVVQLALASIVLVITSVLVNAIWQTSRIALPFDPSAVFSAEVRLVTRELSDPNARGRFFEELLKQVRALPGVTHVTLTDRYPVERSGVYQPVELAGGRVGGDEIGPTVSDTIAAGFFRDLQIPLREGREFLETDGPQSERVAVVNESLAQMAWPDESPLGKRFRPKTEQSDEPWLTVVGVVRNLATDRTPRASACYHLPLQQTLPANVLLYVRSGVDVLGLQRSVREVVRRLSPDVPFDRPMTLAARMEERIAPLRIFAGLALAFGVSALFLAAVGVYGVTAFAVQRRTREFGIRMALGAKPSDLLAAVFKGGIRQMALGLSVGMLLGWAASQPAGRAVSGHASGAGPVVYAVILIVIVTAVTWALWVPARRAAAVDPMRALRAE